MSETGTAPETVIGDRRGSAGTRTDKECGQYTRGGPKKVIEIFRGQHWQSFMHWQKRELSGHQSATVGVVLRGMIETASQPPYKDSLRRVRMDSGFAGQSSPDSQWPQEVVSSGLSFREGCADQTALREPHHCPWQKAPGAEVWVSSSFSH